MDAPESRRLAAEVSCAAGIALLVMTGWTPRTIGTGERGADGRIVAGEPLRVLLHPRNARRQNLHWTSLDSVTAMLELDQPPDAYANDCNGISLVLVRRAEACDFIVEPTVALVERRVHVDFKFGRFLPGEPGRAQ